LGEIHGKRVVIMDIIRPGEYDIPAEESAAFTGHRPDKLPWGLDEGHYLCREFKQKLERAIVSAYEGGIRYFLSGMAYGVDLYAAEAVLRLSEQYPDMKLVAVYPFAEKNMLKLGIAERAYRVVCVCDEYSSSCYSMRNSFLVEHSALLICGFSGDMRSGTASTMRRARRENKRIIVISTGTARGEEDASPNNNK
jgi:uncharacterized phage-like protein YoqJ